MLHSLSRRLTLSILGLFLAAGLGAATVHDHPWCGTGRIGFRSQAAIHRHHQHRVAQERLEKGLAPASPEAVRAGDVAVLVDDGSLLVRPNPLDLDGFGVQYVPQKKGGLIAAPSADPIDPAVGDRLSLSDDDGREVAFPKGFKFRFYNKNYTKMFVHSDGNLTFAASDAGSDERSLDRLLGGPPRIAPLFTDLNPEIASGDGGVYVLASKTKVVITWLEVPEFGRTSSRNTAQVVLYPNGRITVAFGDLDVQTAVVGVAPGGGGDVQLLDYTASLPSGIVKVGIAERFGTETVLDNAAIAKAFFREFADDYDHLIVFLGFEHDLGDAFAFELTVKNEITGIGDDIFDLSQQAGSKGRLRSFVQMGSLSQYDPDPRANILGTNSALDILSHESGHRWLARLNFMDGNGQPADTLLGRQRAHWSFCFNSLASFMEGNLLREDGGDRFTSIGATDRFSPLDQYAMGLIPASEVPPFYFVDGCPDRERAPSVGTPITGRRVDLTLDDVIAVAGTRVPAANRAPHSFNMAFILVAPPGSFPSDQEIAMVDRFRAEFGPHFAAATDGNGAVSTALKLKPRRGR